MNLFKLSNVVAVIAASVLACDAFTPLGPGGAEANPTKQWQLPGQNSGWDIGYNQVGDIGAPMELIEAYRWNVPVITYAFDESFIRYFGKNGMRAVDQAFAILNDLPAASRMTTNLDEFPLSTMRLNYEALQLGLLDLKSSALAELVEEMGLAQADRWVWAIRHRTPIAGTPYGVYDVVHYNFDPVTLQRSAYVNGTLFSYHILEIGPPLQVSDAVEDIVPVDAIPNYPVSSKRNSVGTFFTGLTRDDAGGLRYLYSPKNLVAETLLPTVSPGLPGGWLPVFGTNAGFVLTNSLNGTNGFFTAGVRGGVNKIRFQRVFFDSLLSGGFRAITNQYNDRVIGTNSQFVTQPVERAITRPDIVFTVSEDLYPQDISRTDTTGWINNDLLTPEANLGGPGIIAPPITITFSMVNPTWVNQTPFFITETDVFDPIGTGGVGRSFTWASFDGTTNAPIIYPEYLHFSINDIRRLARESQ